MSRLKTLERSELIRCMGDLGLMVRAEDLREAKAEDVCEWYRILAANAMGFPPDSLSQVPMHLQGEDSSSDVAKLKIMLCSTLHFILKNIDENAEILVTITHLCHPEPSKVQRVLSILLGFIHLRQSKAAFVQGLLEKRLKCENDLRLKEVEKQRLEERLRDGEEAKAERNRQLAPLKEEKARLLQEKSKQDQEVAKWEAAANRTEEDLRKAAERKDKAQAALAAAKEELAVLRRKIVPDADKLKADVRSVERRRAEVEAKVTEALAEKDAQRRRQEALAAIREDLPAYAKANQSQRELLQAIGEDKRRLETVQAGEVEAETADAAKAAEVSRLGADLASRKEAATAAGELHERKLQRVKADSAELERKLGAYKARAAPTSADLSAQIQGEIAAVREEMATMRHSHGEALKRMRQGPDNSRRIQEDILHAIEDKEN